MKVSFLLCVAALLGTASADNWAVIAAGSSGYGNYRHQADACHAYQIVKKHGIPESNIILMMADDVANSWRNHFKGKLYNKPCAGNDDCVDVYEGCKVSYKGRSATSENFLKILSGDTSAGGPVVNSTADDKVFVNFVDHGGSGIVAFPSGPYLHADDLVSTLKTMYSKKLYKELVFYMEACESGSMFKGLLPTNINVYATTAANAAEPSWGTYCPPNDIVNGHNMNTCLGDLYSVNWMEDSDTANFKQETLKEQFNKVKQLTNKSHPQEFGTQDFTKEPIGDFEGEEQTSAIQEVASVLFAGKTQAAADVDAAQNRKTTDPAGTAALARVASAVDAREVDVHLKYYEYLRATDMQARHAASRALIAELQARELMDNRFSALAVKLFGNDAMLTGPSLPPTKFSCIKAANAAVADACGAFSDYTLKYSHVTVNACEQDISLDKIVAAAHAACKL